MNKFYLNAVNFNGLSRSDKGAHTQRIWTKEFPGLGVDLGKLKKTFIFKFKSPETGKVRIFTVDSFLYENEINDDQLDRVVLEYFTLKGLIRDRIDPLTQREDARRQQKETVEAEKTRVLQEKQEVEEDLYTLNRVFDDYTQTDAFLTDISEATRAMYTHCHKKHIAQTIGKIPVRKLKRMDIKKMVDMKTNSRRNLILSILMKVQEVALDNEIIDTPFCHSIKRKRIPCRTRVIEDLPGFIGWIMADGDHQTYKNAMLAQLLYGTRANELNKLEWGEVDFEADLININWARVKTKRVAGNNRTPLQLPLMPMMKTILEQQKGLSNIFVFPQLSKDKPTTSGLIYKLLERRGYNHSSHDIRRTVATELREKLDCTVDDIDTVLDHSLGAVSGAYIHSSGVAIKRRILSRWHSHLITLLDTSVTPIFAAK